jgi:hypothetical protein
VTTDDTSSSDPTLHWTAIAAHARAEHGAHWATDTDTLTAIIGAFDGILPDGYGYHAAHGASRPGAPAGPLLAWRDPRMLGCAIAALATGPRACDLQSIYGTENIIIARTPPPASPG